MRYRSIARLIVSVLTGIVLYLVPAVLWFFEDLSGAMLMFLYLIESIVTVLFAVVCVLVLAPAVEEPRQGNYSRKTDLVRSFALISSGFIAGCLVFVTLFVFLILKEEFVLSEIRWSLTLILGFQLFELISNLFLMRPLSLKNAELFLSESLGGIAVIFICVFLGMFLALFVERWFVMPFLVLNGIILVGTPIQYFWKGRTVAADSA